jgi:hypothetical protein
VALFVDLFLDAHRGALPRQIILDLDATDVPLHGHQEGRFFHGYYDRLLLPPPLRLLRPPPAGGPAAARRAEGNAQRAVQRLRPRGADGLVRDQPGGLRLRPRAQRPPGRGTRHRDGLGRGRGEQDRPAGPPLPRLPLVHPRQLVAAPARHRGHPTKRSLRGDPAKAEWTRGEANPRFIVTSLRPAEADARFLYERVYCARGEMENRIKECQLDLFADRASAASMRANQLRLWFAAMAYVLLCARYRIGLAHTQFAEATCGTLRLALLKIGALVRISVRRITLAMASAHPFKDEFALAHARLTAAAP